MVLVGTPNDDELAFFEFPDQLVQSLHRRDASDRHNDMITRANPPLATLLSNERLIEVVRIESPEINRVRNHANLRFRSPVVRLQVIGKESRRRHDEIALRHHRRIARNGICAMRIGDPGKV